MAVFRTTYHVLHHIWFRFQHTSPPGSGSGEFGDLHIKFCACFTRQCYLYRHDVHHSWLVIYFIEKHNFCCFWISSILKREGRICRLRGWTMVRGVELIPLYWEGELRSGMPMLGFWPSILHCPQKFVISRFSWKPAHWHSIVFITGWRHCGCAVTRQWSHPEFSPDWVGQNSADAAGSTAHATWWHYPQFLWLQ